MYTKDQLTAVQDRLRSEGMVGLLQPPPLTSAEKLIRAVLIVAIVGCAAFVVYRLV
jgi:hypothetical protein